MNRRPEIGIVGFGVMGSGIAQVCTVAAHDVVVVDVDQVVLDGGIRRLTESLEKGISLGKVDAGSGRAAIDRVRTSTDMGSLARCELVIESVTEDRGIKARALEAISEVVEPETIIATNTSSMSVTTLAPHVSYGSRFAGLHFFNPAPAMKLVEIIPGIDTDAQTVMALRTWVEAVGKDYAVVKDQPGFLVNAIFIPYMNQAIDELDSGLASAADIDLAVRLGLGYPKGPFELLDLIGLDTHLHASAAAYQETADVRYNPPPLLRRLVAAGRLGRKVGKGIRDMDSKP